MLKQIIISTDNINHNISQIKKRLKDKVKLLAVVKSDAYGHGLVEVSKAIETNVDFFGVDDFEEAIELRDNNIKKPILVFGPIKKSNLKQAAANDIRVSIYNQKSLNEALLFSNLKVHLKINTGLNRLGVEPSEADKFASKIDRSNSRLYLEGIWSHFADSDSLANRQFSRQQIERFKQVKAKLNSMNIKPYFYHLSNSAGIINYDQAQFDLVRSGNLIYGYNPSPDNYLDLKPVLTFKSQLIQIRQINKDQPVGYDLSYRADKKKKIGVIPVGYKDGYPRQISNKGQVLIRGKRCPVIGRICMRMMMVDLSGVGDVVEGEEVVLIGRQQSDRIDAREIGERANSSQYEILARLDRNLKRIYE